MAENNIKVLSEKDKVRKKISVWLGSNNHQAVMHCGRELVGNSEDEINKGNGDTIWIYLDANCKTITFIDNCQGLPVEGVDKETGTENYKLLTEVLFAGTKYDNGLDGNEDYTVGTNGVFLTVLTRSSEEIKFEVARPNGNVYYFDYYKGDLRTPIKVIGKSDKTYTKITYRLDDEVYDENYYTYEELCELAREQASLINGKIIVADKKTNRDNTYFYSDGIRDLLHTYTHKLNILSEPVRVTRTVEKYVDKQKANDNVKLDMVFQYSKEDEVVQTEFLNGSNLVHHGTIYDGIVAGMKNGFNKFIKDNGLYQKNEKAINNDDVMTGLNYIINFKSYFPTFANQTKFATMVVYYKDIMKETLEYYLEVLATENKELMLKMANQILLNKRVREKSEKSRSDIKKKLEGTISIVNKVDGFIDCKFKMSDDEHELELYIAEGQSALGSIIMSRNADFQACMPVRGKVMNCLKAELEKIFGSEIIVNLLKVLGCGIEVKSKHNKELNSFDKSRLRWKRIIIATDQDVDGFQIRTLLLTIFYKLTPTLVKEGYIYIAESPLFEVVQGDNMYYAYDEQELAKITKGLKGKYQVNRNKGLGEVSSEVMSETMMHPETRRISQVTVKDVEAMAETFELFMGDKVAPRKAYLEEYFDKYLEMADV
jgi:DNA gyrase subunit B